MAVLNQLRLIANTPTYPLSQREARPPPPRLSWHVLSDSHIWDRLPDLQTPLILLAPYHGFRKQVSHSGSSAPPPARSHNLGNDIISQPFTTGPKTLHFKAEDPKPHVALIRCQETYPPDSPKWASLVSPWLQRRGQGEK